MIPCPAQCPCRPASIRPGSSIGPCSEHEIGLWFEPRGLTRISFVVASPVVASPTDNVEGFPRVANIKSQIKRNKQNEKAHQRNKAVKSSLRTSVRKFREAADAG